MWCVSRSRQLMQQLPQVFDGVEEALKNNTHLSRFTQRMKEMVFAHCLFDATHPWQEARGGH